MSEFQTLEELKAANAAAETEQAAVDQQEVEQPEEVEAADEETETPDDTEAQGESEVEEEWLKGDEGQSQAVPLSKHVEMRHKLKARISDKESENEQLKRRIEQLESGYAAPQQPVTLKMPKLSEFDFDEDKYAEAMAGYQEQLLEAKLAQKLGSREQQQAQQMAEKQREEKVEQHYERAAKLVSSTPGFTEEKYKAADFRVRQELHHLTGNGDLVADELIARLGDGSERVITHLGINSAKLATLKQKLIEDNSGLSASMWLGELKTELAKGSTVKLSKAPKPDSGIKGDAGGSSTMSTLMKKYKAAHDSGNTQKAFDLKQQAKRAGHNTSNW